MRRATLLATAVLLSPAPVPADIIHVPDDYPTIQAALSAATDGDEVVVAPGTYPNRLTMGPVSVVLRSESGDPTDTILDGGWYTTETLLSIVGDATGERRVEGFTFRNAPRAMVTAIESETGIIRIVGNRFVDNGPFGTVQAEGRYTEVIDNEFLSNQAYFWGGALRVGGSALIQDNWFSANQAIPYLGNDLTEGGAIHLMGIGRSGLTVEIRDNRFEDNSCDECGGAIDVVAFDAEVLITGNEFLANVGGECAGAIYQFGSFAHLTIESNLFMENQAPWGASIGIQSASGTVIRGNTVVRSRGGEGIRLESNRDVIVDRNLVALGEASGIIWQSFDLALTCNDSFGNAGLDYTFLPSTGGNLSVDPLFCNAGAGDYTLEESSMCLPAQNACAVQIGALGQGCDTTPVIRTSWGALKGRHR